MLVFLMLLPCSCFADDSVYGCIPLCKKSVPTGCSACLATAREQLSPFAPLSDEQAGAVESGLTGVAKILLEINGNPNSGQCAQNCNAARDLLDSAEQKIAALPSCSEKEAYTIITGNMRQTVDLVAASCP